MIQGRGQAPDFSDTEASRKWLLEELYDQYSEAKDMATNAEKDSDRNSANRVAASLLESIVKFVNVEEPPDVETVRYVIEGIDDAPVSEDSHG